MLEHNKLLEILRYDPATGIFTWLVSRHNGIQVGAIAGGINSRGYIVIMIDGKTYTAHRLAWFYMTGEWPEDDIDHIDMDRKNNAFENIRSATRSQNEANKRILATNTSGFKGVSFHKRARKWKAQIRDCGKVKHLGLFETPEQAHDVYVAAAKFRFGEFARM